MKYYLIAGEASGDLHGSNLMKALAVADPQAEFRFLGGDMMLAVGGTRVRHYKDTAYMGVWPVITHLGTILSSGRQCFDDIQEWNPDVVILIDYPGFNLTIAKLVKTKLSIPTYYYISPKIWAWKGYRIKSMRKYVDELFSILPFEVDWFAQRNYTIHYVGNPCVDAVQQYRDSSPTPPAFPVGKPVIALLAGSRRTEISRNLPLMIQAVADLTDYSIVLAAAPGIEDSFYSRWTDGTGIMTVRNSTYSVLANAHAALVTSGTATLETALFRVPQVVCYRMPVGGAVRIIRKAVLKIPFISLVNLIDSSSLVPELVADDMNVQCIRQHLLPLLADTPERRAQLEGYERIIATLGPAGASTNAAAQMVSMLRSKQMQDTDSVKQ